MVDQLADCKFPIVVNYDKSRQPVADLWICRCHHGRFLYRRMPIKRGLDVSKLDPIATTLDLIVPAADESIIAVYSKRYQVSASIYEIGITRLEWILK